MTQYSFKSDYNEGAHPDILSALSQTNFCQEEGYGEDEYCKNAAKIIKKKSIIQMLTSISFQVEHRRI